MPPDSFLALDSKFDQFPPPSPPLPLFFGQFVFEFDIIRDGCRFSGDARSRQQVAREPVLGGDSIGNDSIGGDPLGILAGMSCAASAGVFRHAVSHRMIKQTSIGHEERCQLPSRVFLFPPPCPPPLTSFSLYPSISFPTRNK